jgi:hypothetical protein
MWALVNKYNIVIDCLVGITFEEAKTYETNGRFLVEMTLENSPANLGSHYDGKNFSMTDDNNMSIEKDYKTQVSSVYNSLR